MAKYPAVLSRDDGANLRELEKRISEFTAKASAVRFRTLLSIMRRWLEMRGLLSCDPLFASIVAEFRSLLDVQNVPE